MKENELPMLTVKEAAEYLRSTPGAIRTLIWRRKLRAFKPGKKLLIRKKDLDCLIESSALKRGGF